MSFRDRVHNVAVGGCLIAGVLVGSSALAQQQNRVGDENTGQSGTKHEAPESPTTKPATTHFAPGNRVDGGTYRAICDSPKDKDHADLCQQWRVAEAAEAQIALSVFAVLLLFGTFVFTGIAAAAARQTVTTMQDTARRQLRAYVSIKSVHLKGIDGNLETQVAAINAGATPAYDLTFWANVDVQAFPLRVELGEDKKPTKLSRSILGPGIETFTHTGVGKTDQLTPAQRDYVKSPNGAIFVYGQIDYRDAFGAARYTRFRYYAGGDFAFRADHLTGAAEDGNSAT